MLFEIWHNNSLVNSDVACGPEEISYFITERASMPEMLAETSLSVWF